MTQRLLPLILTVIVPYAWADTLYKCTGPDGRITYTNQKTGKNCEVISQDKPVSTFSPPPRKERQATPGDFPRVNGEQQKARDNDRRTILETELANEEKNLEAAKKELAEQENLTLPEERIAGGGIQGAKREARIQSYRDKVRLHERNIESLRRELANLR
ncbi:MAG: DUF4124 domain-containing protein [Rhodocyclaceae bacterium]|jgi:hypothetical protein|nr:DUF4124 domain-containing protein [Rhodocyclaceae bacterium]